MKALTSASKPASAITASTVPPESLTSFAVSFTLSLRSTAINLAPSLANSPHAARPMPLPAPVMMTDLPSRRPMVFSLCLKRAPPCGILPRAARRSDLRPRALSRTATATLLKGLCDVQSRQTVCRSARRAKGRGRDALVVGAPRAGARRRRQYLRPKRHAVRLHRPRGVRRGRQGVAAQRAVVCLKTAAHPSDSSSDMGGRLPQTGRDALRGRPQRAASRRLAGPQPRRIFREPTDRRRQLLVRPDRRAVAERRKL